MFILAGQISSFSGSGQWMEDREEITSRGGRLAQSLPGSPSSTTMADPSFRLDLDLASLGIDAEQTFEGLLSPSGTVNEWALSITLTTMMTIGFVIAG